MMTITTHRSLLPALTLSAAMAVCGPAAADESIAMEEPMAIDHQHHHHDMQAMAHAHAVRSISRYDAPDVLLTDTRGRPVSLRSVLADKDPLMLNFIYTSCTSVCPVMSGIFSQVQTRLGKEVRLLSISIDPEYDTPARLKDYAEKFSAGPNWTMLTGSLQDSVAVQRAFAVYRGDKMDHAAATFVRANPDQPWIRLDGLASAEDLIQEFRRLVVH